MKELQTSNGKHDFQKENVKNLPHPIEMEKQPACLMDVRANRAHENASVNSNTN